MLTKLNVIKLNVKLTDKDYVLNIYCVTLEIKILFKWAFFKNGGKELK